MENKLKVLFDAGMNWQFIPARFRTLMEERFNCVFLDHKHLNDAMRSWLAKWSDAIFVDWALEWAQFYLENFPEKRIIIRTHRADVWHIDSPFYFWENADAVLFMNNRWRETFLEECEKNVFEDLSERCYTVPRLIDEQHWRFLHDLTAVRKFGKRLGMLGRIVPWKGCEEIAALMKNELRDFTLSLKGLSEADTRQHADYVSSIRVGDRVSIQEHSEGDSVVKWFADIDFIISNSSIESWHAAITEGMLCGCVPIVRHWEGAEQIHPPEFVFDSLADLVRELQSFSVEMNADVISDITELYLKRKRLSDRMREWCLERYRLEDITGIYADIIEGKDIPIDCDPKDMMEAYREMK